MKLLNMKLPSIVDLLEQSELDLEAKGSYVTRRGHVGGLEGDEEGLEDVLFKLESSLDVLAWSWYAAAKKEEQGTIWGGSISPEGFMSSVLLWLVIIIAVGVGVTVVVVIIEKAVTFPSILEVITPMKTSFLSLNREPSWDTMVDNSWNLLPMLGFPLSQSDGKIRLPSSGLQFGDTTCLATGASLVCGYLSVFDMLGLALLELWKLFRI
ncbi:hypothetical protein Tco_1186235 [Tanacetum coccineum]